MTAIDDKELRKVKPQLEWLPRRLRELREQAGFTQAQVGAAMGISLKRVWDTESGRNDPKWSTVCRQALAMGVPIDRLMEGCPRTYNYEKVPAAARGGEFAYLERMLSSAKLDAAQWKAIEKLAKEKRQEVSE